MSYIEIKNLNKIYNMGEVEIKACLLYTSDAADD